MFTWSFRNSFLWWWCVRRRWRSHIRTCSINGIILCYLCYLIWHTRTWREHNRWLYWSSNGHLPWHIFSNIVKGKTCSSKMTCLDIYILPDFKSKLIRPLMHCTIPKKDTLYRSLCELMLRIVTQTRKAWAAKLSENLLFRRSSK